MKPLVLAGTVARGTTTLIPKVMRRKEHYLIMPQLMETLMLVELDTWVGSLQALRGKLVRGIDAL